MHLNRVIGSSLLITGTCIGAGMLALPIATAGAGFYLSVSLLIVCWFAMYYTGLLVLEANLRLDVGANFISMAKATLGKGGELVAWLTYLLLLYSLIAAYLSAGGDIFVDAARMTFHQHFATWMGPLPWIAIVGLFITLGAAFVDYFNRALMIGLIASYFALLVVGLPNINVHLYSSEHPGYLFGALTIVVAAFGYHVTIPSLRCYLKGHVKALKITIFVGSLLPLVTYIVWEAIVFGSIPVYGPHGLMSILHSGQPASQLTSSLIHLEHSQWVTWGTRFFILFAIASSFLGIAFSLFDFMADSFHIRKSASGKLLLACMTFIPPFLYVLLYPHGFILALSYAGIFVAILHGILPAMMVWSGRRKERRKEHRKEGGVGEGAAVVGAVASYRVLGGNLALLLVLLFSFLVILAQVVYR